MNKKDRQILETISASISLAKTETQIVLDGEQIKFDNLSEGLQASEKGEKLEQGIEYLQDAIDQLDEAIDNINNAID